LTCEEGRVEDGRVSFCYLVCFFLEQEWELTRSRVRSIDVIKRNERDPRPEPVPERRRMEEKRDASEFSVEQIQPVPYFTTYPVGIFAVISTLPYLIPTFPRVESIPDWIGGMISFAFPEAEQSSVASLVQASPRSTDVVRSSPCVSEVKVGRR